MSSRLPPPFDVLSLDRPFTLGEPVTLDARAAAGLGFRKVNVKESFTLRDGRGDFYRCALHALGADRGEALPYEKLDRSPESNLALTVVCAVLQRQRMLPVAQKVAELGAMRLQPVVTLKSVAMDGLAHEKEHAWPGQAVKGARQCRRGSVPVVEKTVLLKEVFATAWWKGAAWRLFLDDRSDTEAASLFEKPAVGAAREGVLVVGPEGGFADVERRALREAGALAWRLGGRVLRAETAVFAGVSVLQDRLGDLGG